MIEEQFVKDFFVLAINFSPLLKCLGWQLLNLVSVNKVEYGNEYVRVFIHCFNGTVIERLDLTRHINRRIFGIVGHVGSDCVKARKRGVLEVVNNVINFRHEVR